jgi:chromosome segregation ATPase
MEQQVASVTPEVEIHKRKAEQLSLHISELMDQIQTLKQKNEQYIGLLHQKASEIEGLVDGHRKATEQASVLKRRMEQLSKGEGGETEQYRLLLMCQSCNNNFKSHTLLKCMHTFW